VNLRTKISLHTTIMITLALCIAGGLYIGFLRVSLRNALFDGLRSSSIASSEAISRFLIDSLRDSQAVAFALPAEAIKERNTAAIDDKLKTLAEIFPHFDNGMFILDPEGRLWSDYPSHPETREADFSFREYFQRTIREGRGIISTPYKSSRTDEPVITFTAPLRDSSNNLAGILGCSSRLLSASATGIISTTKIGHSGYVFVFDKTRLMIIHPDSRRILQRDVPPGSNPLLDAAVDKGFTGVGETVNSRGVAMVASVSKIPGMDWVLVAQQPTKEAYAPIREAVRRILIGIVIAGLLSISVTMLIVRRMTGSLVKLREAAVDLGRSVDRVDGNWQEETQSLRSELASIIRSDEIGDLAAAFTEMCSGLEKALFSLSQTKDMLQALIQSAPVAIDMMDSERKVLMWNPAAERILGWKAEEVIGKLHPMASDGMQEDYPDLIKAAFDGRIVNSIKTQQKRKDGSLINVSLSAAPVYDGFGKVFGAMEILVDITENIRAEQEQSRLETQLRQAHKMEAIGTLAGGIAHDFNNILSAIIGYSELALTKMPEGTQARRNVEQVLKAGFRARDLVKQILAFSRKAETEKKVLQLSTVIKETLSLLRASLPSTIQIKEDLQEGKSVVLADATQIHQVVMNLCTNAAHSMNEKGGVLEIGLSRVDASAAPHTELEPGAYMRLTVKDTGHGMTRETMDRIFDPYFTTKHMGVGGTGLGLAVVRGIVKSYGGAIGVESEPGVGSSFEVFLPEVDEEVSTQSPLQKHHQGGSAHILFVDDEASLVDVGRQMLEHLGYTVTTRTSSIEALEAFRADPKRFDLVITDTTMPNMTGIELSSEIRRVRADIPIILCTGFSEMATPEKTKVMGIQELIMKPLAITDMARAIRRVLD